MVTGAGCATPRASLQRLNASELYKEICARPLPARVEGDLGLSYRGPEGSVSLNATGVADARGVRVAVVNPVGETEASLKVEGNRLSINRQGKVEDWRGNWRGIPVEFVHRLMRGGAPCLAQEAKGRPRVWIADDELRVSLANRQGYSEEFDYTFVMEDDRRVLREIVWSAQVVEHPKVAVTVWGADWKAEGPNHELEVRWRRRSVDTGR